jgi:hypothetical protein
VDLVLPSAQKDSSAQLMKTLVLDHANLAQSTAWNVIAQELAANVFLNTT